MTRKGTIQMMRMPAVLLGIGCLLLADDQAPQKVQVTHTETLSFPAGGRLLLKHSIGELTIQGWDRPDVEITTITSTPLAVPSRDRERATHELDRVHVSAASQGQDLVVTTVFPRHWDWLTPWHTTPAKTFELEYVIKVPMTARLDVDQVGGEVHIHDVTSDIRVVNRDGLITLLLPPDSQYEIDAKSKLGDVISDFSGREERKLWFGHSFVGQTKAAHKMYLRTCFGDIVIYKSQKPPAL